ncbi:prephenate dehydrogenase/arogenate dehydrogenase family protein, partial [SAR202 cluster bacterium AD-802-E10_MRT_200m]|nr:prephenate dehydrogenase/arogenate dehydrogenase family protein [SAR202 cluster bacterium AD-802-E10_MRT_200m]
VGGHPMAGRESSGPEAAEATLFDGATYAICATPSAESQAVQTLASMVETIGATPFFIGAEEHDSYVAAVSHLPFILSVALVACTSDSPSWDDISTLAASGYRDITRLASGDPVMHRDICVTNQESIIKWIDQFITYLYKFRNDVRDDPDAVELAFISAWQARSRWLSGAKVNQSTVSADIPSANDSMMGLVMGDRMSSRLRELNEKFGKNNGNDSSR